MELKRSPVSIVGAVLAVVGVLTLLPVALSWHERFEVVLLPGCSLPFSADLASVFAPVGIVLLLVGVALQYRRSGGAA